MLWSVTITFKRSIHLIIFIPFLGFFFAIYRMTVSTNSCYAQIIRHRFSENLITMKPNGTKSSICVRFGSKAMSVEFMTFSSISISISKSDVRIRAIAITRENSIDLLRKKENFLKKFSILMEVWGKKNIVLSYWLHQTSVSWLNISVKLAFFLWKTNKQKTTIELDVKHQTEMCFCGRTVKEMQNPKCIQITLKKWLSHFHSKFTVHWRLLTHTSSIRVLFVGVFYYPKIMCFSNQLSH